MNHRTVLASLTALAVTGGLAVGIAAPATAAPDPAPSADAATWLVGELTDGLLVGEFGPDAGLTIDAALALDVVGGHDEDVQAIADAVATNVDADNPEYNYVSGEAFGDAGSTYAGAVAKTLVLADAAGRDLTTFGGENFVTRLEGVVSDDVASAGRIVDVSSFGDNANTFGQSFAVRALDAAGSARTDAATDYLLLQQCDEGFFRQSLGATAAATCDADANAAGSVDGTALAILNLLSQADDTDVQAAITDAAAWLAQVQRADGSFGSDAAIPASNANSTGLAGWALDAASSPVAAEKVAVWLRGHQFVNTASCTPFAPVDEGAIAYDDAALRGGAVTPALRDQFRRGSAQALPALALAPDGVTSEVTSNNAYVAAGSTQRVPVSASPGDIVCVKGPGGTVTRRVPASGSTTLSVKLPAGTGNRSYVVEDSQESLGTVVFRTLGAKTFGMTVRKPVVRGKKQFVQVRGLAAGEQVRVFSAGKLVGTGKATAAGTYQRSFVIPRTAKLGPRQVRVVGQFGNRSAKRTFKVTAAR